jgi:pimeloyl-ACP methyl ester carboxylesterase
MRVVFVHGAFVRDGAWWWSRMEPELKELGLGSQAVELPSCGPSEDGLGDLYADSDAVRAVLDEDDEPVLLCGHSYGGVVITDAAAGHPNVRHLIYITSFLPDRHESLADFSAEEPAPFLDPGDDGTVGVRAELLPPLFMQDCDEDAVAEGLSRVTRQSGAVFGQLPRAVAWRTIPSTYVVCADDLATSPELQRAQALRAGRVVELATGHHPFISRPDLLAAVLGEIAAAEPANR